MTNGVVFRSSLVALITLFAHPLLGGVVLDGSFGTHGPLPGPNFMITAPMGKLVNTNLFHSFNQFNLNSSQSATFTGPSNVQNILARVTSGSPSSIDGTIRSDIQGANLFFMNPAGVLFGQHAQLDVSGSFAVTTANYLSLVGGGKFNANLGGGDVLTSAPVSAFGFLNSAPAPVSIAGSNSARDSRGNIIPGAGLNIQPQKSFSIVAGNIGMNASTISGPGSRVNLVSVKSPGEVELDATNINSTIGLNQFTALGTIDLRNLALVDTSGPGGGPMFIRAANINISNSQISSQTFGSIDGGTLDIALTGDVKLTDGASVVADTAGQGSGSNITLTADSLFIKGLAMLRAPFTGIATASTMGATGNAGDLTITIGNRISILGGGVIGATTFSSGDGGNITIHAGSLYMNSLADIPGNLTGILDRSERGATGDAGDVTVTVDHALSIVSGSEISTATFTSGQGGDVTIHAGSLLIDNSLTDGGPTTLPTLNGPVNLLTGISAAATSGAGDAGKIDLTVTGPLQMLGHGQIFDGALRGSTGSGGDITIQAGSLSIDDTGTDVTLVNPTRRVDISAETRGIGNAGSINIDVDGQLSIIGTGEIAVSTISLRSDTPVGPPRSIASGDAGDLTIHAGSLLIEGFATPSRVTVDPKNVTGIAAIAKADGRDSNSGTTDTTGNAGNLTIDIDQSIKILGGGQINSSTFSNGDAGNITIRADSLYMNSLADIPGNLTGILNRSEGSATGDAGDVTITVDHVLSIVSGSEISAATFSGGQGGDVIIRAGSLLIDNSLTDGGPTTLPTLNGPVNLLTGISAAATGGTGDAGNIDLTVTGPLRMLGHGQIFDGTIPRAPSTIAGDGGNITIHAGSLAIDDTGTDVTLVNPTRRIDISAETRSSGDAGMLNIIVDGPVSIFGSGEIAVTTFSSGEAGDLTLQVRSLSIDGSITPDFDTGIFVASEKEATGDAGNLTITVDKLLSIVGVSSRISAETFSSGEAGSINIHAGSLSIDGLGSPDASAGISANTYATGNAGDLTITVDKLSIVRRGLISASTYSSGKAGDVSIHTNSLSIDGSGTMPGLGTGISADTFGTGDAGKLSITVDRLLTIAGRGQISARTFSYGNAGGISIHAGSLSIDGSATPGDETGIFVLSDETSPKDAIGDAGNLTVTVDGTMNIVAGGKISAVTHTGGKGGDVTLQTGSLSIDGSADPLHFTGIEADSSAGATGDAGNITINVNQALSVAGTGGITAATFSSGNGGNLAIHAGSLSIDGSATPGLFTGIFVASTGSGEAGRVSIETAGPVKLRHGATISTSSDTTDAGSIDIISGGIVKLRDQSSITVSAGHNGGDINITTPDLVYLLNSSITATAGTNGVLGAGGNIRIDSQFIVLNNSLISANAAKGQGGNISLVSDFFFNSDLSNNNITATGTKNGTVNITAPALDLGAELITLPNSILSAESQLQERCTALLQGDFSSFISIGRGGTEPAPEELQTTF